MLTVLEIPVCGWLSPLLLGMWLGSMCGRFTQERRLITLRNLGNEREGGKGWNLNIPLILSSDLTPSNWVNLLKVYHLPKPQAGDQAFTTWAFGRPLPKPVLDPVSYFCPPQAPHCSLPWSPAILEHARDTSALDVLLWAFLPP